MTQSSLQTQCPKCRTRFRVTDEQLGIAKGKVRCGNCMEIFNAKEHQLPGAQGSAPDTPDDSGGKSPPEGATATGFTSEDPVLFDDNPEEDAEEDRYAGNKLTFADDELSDSFRSFDPQDASEQDSPDSETSTEEVDESWAEAMLQEDSTPAMTGPDSEPEPQFSEPGDPEPETTSPGEADASAQRPENNPENDTRKPAEPAFTATADESEAPADDEPFRADVPFGDLRREPVSVERKNRSWLRKLVWTLVVLGLLGILIAQVAWFQFDRLSAIPELRPFYEKGCELAGCELEPLINVDAIQSRKLVVKTDPENRNQLVVDAVIVNQADFQQPFPALALTFSNLNGDVIAQSVFTPSEYLAGDASDLEIMPTETPVRIAIRIRDPGRDAVNYNIRFRPHAP